VKQLKDEHEQLQLEMTQRDDLFSEIDERAVEATKCAHPRVVEMQGFCDAVMRNREALFRQWAAKNARIDELAEVRTFERDAAQLVALLGSQEAFLRAQCEDAAPVEAAVAELVKVC